MTQTRLSGARKANAGLVYQTRKAPSSNLRWVQSTGIENGVILLGGTSTVDFHIRVAQSRARHDLSPSHWSIAGLLRNGKMIDMVPIDSIEDVQAFGASNGVDSVSLRRFDDPKRYPNIAVIQFTEADRTLRRALADVRARHDALDIPALAHAWLGYLWGIDDHHNPLVSGIGLPSAALVEAVYVQAGLDVTPGLASEASCPEAIWQAAKWWHDYYKGAADEGGGGDADPIVPKGYCVVRQEHAAIVS